MTCDSKVVFGTAPTAPAMQPCTSLCCPVVRSQTGEASSKKNGQTGAASETRELELQRLLHITATVPKAGAVGAPLNRP
jgi:hypothetical protein